MKEELKGKKFLITGGTGSFGHAVTDRLLKEGAGEIVIFSRDKKKQFDMAKEGYGAPETRCTFPLYWKTAKRESPTSTP